MIGLRQTMVASASEVDSAGEHDGVVGERWDGVEEGGWVRLPSTAITTELDKIASSMVRIEADLKRIEESFRSVEKAKWCEQYVCGSVTKKASAEFYHCIGDVRMEVAEVERMHQLATALRRLGGCEQPQHECKALINRMQAALARAEQHAARVQEEGYSILRVVAGRMLNQMNEDSNVHA